MGWARGRAAGGAAAHRKPSAPSRRIDPGTDGSSIASRGGAPHGSIPPSRHRDRPAGRSGRRDRDRRRRNGGRDKILDVQLVGLAAPVTIVGVTGAGAAWTTDDGSAKLFADGRLDVNVEHLVFVSGANEGTNTVPSDRASVVCNGGATAATSSPTAFRCRSPMAMQIQPVADAAEPVLHPGDLLHQRRRQLVRRQRLDPQLPGGAGPRGKRSRI